MGHTNNLVIVSDLHIGCTMGLCHPDGARLDDGGTYLPSPLQLIVWEWWREFWDTFVPDATKGEGFAVLVNGDAIDGKGIKGSTHQWSHNLGDQCRMAQTILQPLVDAAKGGFYLVRGTEAHVGASAVEEERLGMALGAVPNRIGQYARYDLWKRVGPSLVHALHHIGTTGSSAYEITAVGKELVEEFVEAGRWERPFPDVVVRSHRHQHSEAVFPSAHGRTYSVVTPAWQLKPAFAFKVPGARLSEPQIGGIVIRHAHGETFVRPWIKSLEREEPE
jgi:hypothetical protein